MACRARTGGRANQEMTLTTRLAIAMIALVAVAVSAVGWLSYRSLEQALLPRVLDRIETQFAAGCDRSGIPRPQRARRHRHLSWAGGGHGIDARPPQWRDRSGRQHQRSALARTAGPSTGGPDGDQAGPFAPLHRRRRRSSGNLSRRPFGTERRRSRRSGSRTEARRRRALLPGHDQARRGRDLCLADPFARRERGDRDATGRHHADRDAGDGGRRQAVRDRHRRCRHAAGARPRPVVRCGQANSPIWSTARATISSIRIVRANSARSGARRPTGGATCPISQLARRDERVRAPARQCRTARRRRVRTGRIWPAANGSRSSSRCRERSSWRRRRRSSNSSIIGRIDRGAVRGRAGAADRAIADPADRPADRGGSGRRAQRQGRHSGRCRRRDRRARARVRAGDGGSAMQRPSRSNARSRSIAAPIAARDHHAERERLFSAAVESSNDAIITTSLDGTITGWNSAAERLYGYAAAEVAGKNIAILVPADRLPEVQDTLRRIGWGESIEHNETMRLRKDGSRIEVSLSISPIKAPSGATIGISKVARDITDSNKTQAGAAATDRGTAPRLRDFAGPDHGDGFEGIRGPDQPKLPDHPGLSARRDDRPQRRRLHPSRSSREVARGNARRCGAGSVRRLRTRAASTRTDARCGCPGSASGPNR